MNKKSSSARWQMMIAVGVIHIGFEPMTSSLSRKRSKPAELMNRTVPTTGMNYDMRLL